MFKYTKCLFRLEQMYPVTHWSTQVLYSFLQIQTQISQVKQPDTELYTYQYGCLDYHR
jgi:hypothetical protein